MSSFPVRHNELNIPNKTGFQSTANSSLGEDDFGTIDMNDGNGYLPPFLRSQNMKFALPAAYYLPSTQQQLRYPQKTLVDVFPQPQPITNQNMMTLQPSGYFMAPNPHAFPTIPGCRGGNPVSVQDAMLRGDVTFYQ